MGGELFVLLCVRKGDAAKTDLCLGLERVVVLLMVFEVRDQLCQVQLSLL